MRTFPRYACTNKVLSSDKEGSTELERNASESNAQTQLAIVFCALTFSRRKYITQKSQNPQRSHQKSKKLLKKYKKESLLLY